MPHAGLCACADAATCLCACRRLLARARALVGRYLTWKHEQLLFLDVIGGLYMLGIAAALLKQLPHPTTWVLLALTLLRALPHLPLLMGLRQQHIR